MSETTKTTFTPEPWTTTSNQFIESPDFGYVACAFSRDYKDHEQGAIMVAKCIYSKDLDAALDAIAKAEGRASS